MKEKTKSAARTKAFFLNIHGLGHIQPTLPMVREMVADGGEVVYYTTPARREWVERTGARFRNYGYDSYAARDFHPEAANLVLQLLPAAKGLMPYLLAEVERERPDVIYYDSMAPWGYVLSEVTGIRGVCTCAILALPRAQREAMYQRYGIEVDTVNRKVIAEIRALYGVELSLADALGAYTQENIVFSTKEFNPDMSSETGRHFRFIGPQLERVENLVGFEDLPTPLAYVSFGTVLDEEEPEKVLQLYCSVARELLKVPGLHVLVSLGQGLAGRKLGLRDARLRVESNVPQLHVLRQSSLFVNHAGINSLNEGMALGVPMVVLPQGKDQFINAARAHELGCAVQLMPGQVENLVHEAQKLL